MKKRTNIPTIKLPATKKKASPKKTFKAKPKKSSPKPKPEQHLTPPLGEAPPDIRDARPIHASPLNTVPGPGKNDTTKVVVEEPLPAQKPASTFVPSGRMVMGQKCTWVGDLAEAPDGPGNIPVCPHCKQGLLNAPPLSLIDMGIKEYEEGTYQVPPSAAGRGVEAHPHPGYVAMLQWMREQPTCFAAMSIAALAYQKATGIAVDWKP